MNNIKLYNLNYKELLQNVLEIIRLIYEDLSRNTLLERFVGGFERENSESESSFLKL